jgi:nitrite transporter NirC
MAEDKYQLSKKEPAKYFVRAMVAGFYLVIAIILSYMMAAVLHTNYPEFAKISVAVCFPTAIVLIVFLGGELFTGNNLVMSMGALDKKTTWANAARIWIISYIGNFVGCVIFTFILVKSGSNIDLLMEYIGPLVEKKLHITALEMFLRGILCNFMVCMAYIIGARVKSEGSRIFITFLAIAAFIIGGFEHSIANMGIFSIDFFATGTLPWASVAKSMFFVTLGNIVGGGLLLALPLKFMSINDTHK